MSDESIRLFPSGCLLVNGCYKHVSSCDGRCLLSENNQLWSLSKVHKIVDGELVLQVDINDLKCPSCHKFFHTLDRYVQHLNGKQHIKKYEAYVSESLFVCSLCKAPTTSPSALAQHARKHESTADYFCKICGRSFDTNVSLLQHLDTPAHKLTVKFAELPSD